MPLIKHEFEGEIDPELQEVNHKKFRLNRLMLETIDNAAKLRRKERGWIRGLFAPVTVKSPDVRSAQDHLEPGQELSAWLAGSKRLGSVTLLTQIIDENKTALTAPQVRLEAKEYTIVYPFSDHILTPESQLELVDGALETVEFISDCIRFRL
jgi:hypothetical protein